MFLQIELVSLFWFPTLLCYQNENVADAGREPVTFENPLYSTTTGTAADAAVIHATQVKLDGIHTTSYSIKSVSLDYKLG